MDRVALGEGMRRGAPAGLARLAERLPGAAESVSGADTTLLITRGTLGFYAGRTMAAAADLRPPSAPLRATRRPRNSPCAPAARPAAAELRGLGRRPGTRAAGAVPDLGRQLMWIEAQAHAALATVAAGRDSGRSPPGRQAPRTLRRPPWARRRPCSPPGSPRPPWPAPGTSRTAWSTAWSPWPATVTCGPSRCSARWAGGRP